MQCELFNCLYVVCFITEKLICEIRECRTLYEQRSSEARFKKTTTHIFYKYTHLMCNEDDSANINNRI